MYRIIVLFLTMSILASCARSQGVGYPNFPAFRPLPGQGQYIRPEYLNPLPTPSIPPEDACRSRLYLSLVGRHEGSIFIPGLPGRKRVLKPAFLENFDYQPDDTLYIDPPLIEVREFLPDQILYAPSISTVTDRFALGPIQEDRLTIELNLEGYVEEVRCG